MTSASDDGRGPGPGSSPTRGRRPRHLPPELAAVIREVSERTGALRAPFGPRAPRPPATDGP
ncbi:hypothetical protein [Nocardioides sp.]|uniref:hypothetical protein n=1 Tax=Nocardioides sp. TaxID=35761 RepID=UPI003511354F